MLLWSFPSQVNAQCPELLDSDLNFSDEPYWIFCGGSDYFLTLITDMFVGDYTVDWGDGSPIEVGTGFDVGDISVNHTYAADVDTFILIFTPDPGLFPPSCQITGVIVMEERTTAEIGIPGGVDLSICTPGTFSYVNNSNQTSGKPISETTTFTWDFGDGSPVEVYDYTNAGQTVSHDYLPGTAGCGIFVELTAENYCGITTNLFGPINTWDLDSANITPSDLVLCYPDTIFTFFNTTQMNCQPDNSAQRYEYWNLGDYWGLGYDSIIPWNPWPPAIPQTVGFPGPGSYTVMLLDSSYCGIDTAYQTVTITIPPEVGLTVNPDTICMGESTQFNGFVIANTPDNFSWNFDDGTGWQNLGSGIQNYTYPNSGDYVIQFVGSISAANSGCTDTTSVPLHVQPAPIADINASDTIGCDALTVTFTDNSVGGAVAWIWDFGNGNTSNVQNPPSETYNSPGVYTAVLLAVSSNGCISSAIQMINVWESPVANFMADNVCQGGVSDFFDLSTFPANDTLVAWDWDFGDGNTSTDQNPTNVFANSGSFFVQLTAYTAHCSNTIIIPITVDPKPVMGFFPTPDEGCTTLNVDFTNTTTGAVNYDWDFGDGWSSTLENPSHPFINLGLIDTTYLVQLIAETTFGCADTAYDQITVYPGSLSDFSVGPVPDCAPAPVSFFNNSINGFTYEWNFDDGTPTSNLSDPTHVFNNTTLFIENYNVMLVVFSTNGCSDTSYQTVSVNPQLILDIVANPDSGCTPLTVNFPQSAGDGAVAWFWDFGDGSNSNQQSPSHTFTNISPNDIQYNVSLVAMNAFGCTDTIYTTITVHPLPISQMNASPTFGCALLDVEFENTSTGAIDFIWIYGDGSPNDTTTNAFVQHTFDNNTPISQFYNTTLIAITDKGCTNTSFQQIQVHPKVTADYTVDTLGCSPMNTVFINQSTGANIYEWDFGDGSNTETTLNAQHTYYNSSYLNDTTFTSTLYAISAFNCRDTIQVDITIHPKPLSLFSADDTSGCSPVSANLTNESIGAEFYQWDYGDLTPGSNTTDTVHNHLYYNTGGVTVTFQTQLISESNFGCKDTSYQDIYVSPSVSASFTAVDEACSPAQIQFVNNSSGANDFLWDFGDGTQDININPIHTYINNTLTDSVYLVTLIATGVFCPDTATHLITIHPQPQVQFQIDSILNCYPVEVSLHNLTTGADSYLWNYGDGQTSTDGAEYHSVIYTNETTVPIDYNINLVAQNIYGCIGQFTQPITVLPELNVNIAFDTLGCNPHTIDVDNNTIGALFNFWDFGDGFIDNVPEPSHTYSNFFPRDSIYNLVYVARGYEGCSDTIYQDVYVYQVPEAQFTANPASQVFPDATVNILDLTTADDVSYTWDLGDGTVSNDPDLNEHTYTTWGTYTISLFVENAGCTSSFSQPVIIVPPAPIADFTGGGTGCTPMSVSFTNNSLYADSYLWDFGDGGQSNLENPTYVYYTMGYYNVSLTAFGPGGQNTVIHIDSVHAFPQAFAFFTASTDIVYIPNDPVTYFNLSENSTDLLWDFGDGFTSTEENPIHFYIDEGLYTVSLTANNEFNCPDTYTVENIVEAVASGEVIFPNAFTPNPNGSNGGVYDPNDPSQNLNDVFHPLFSGVEEYQMWIYNRWGELLFESNDILIGWDGYYKGELSQQDVYVWKVKATTSQGTVINDAGDVTLIR
ncbi:MAG: hypothetical protein DRI54_00885 [Bacteroidetes bacterium]|nr:MAG: hypothetical protein DRI54_00885 [Bacteroidota bacterium]